MAVAALIVGVAGGIGWTYLLRSAGLLPYGPDVPGALPLQQLAGGAGQPLMRLAAAWLPAGALAGLAHRRAGLSAVSRVLWTGLPTALLLMSAGAVSDAVTASDAATAHLTGQLGREGTWVAAGLTALGAGLLPRARRAEREAPNAR